MKSIKDKLELIEGQKSALQKKLEDLEIRHSEQIDSITREKLNEYEVLLEKQLTELKEKNAATVDTLTKQYEEKCASLLDNSQLSQNEVTQVKNTYQV